MAIGAILAWLVRQIGLLGCVALGMLAYYEGVPWIGNVPLLDMVPIVGEIAAGQVKTRSDRAVKDATADLVAKSELVEAQAQAAEYHRQMTFNSNMAWAASQAAAAARAEAEASQAELEKRIAADLDPDISRWRAIDFERMQQHR